MSDESIDRIRWELRPKLNAVLTPDDAIAFLKEAVERLSRDCAEVTYLTTMGMSSRDRCEMHDAFLNEQVIATRSSLDDCSEDLVEWAGDLAAEAFHRRFMELEAGRCEARQ